MNEHRARQLQHQQQQKQFLNALSAGEAHAIDVFGVPIVPGMKVIPHFPHPPVFEVVSVTPVFDPKAPPGLMDVMLMARVPVRCMANTPAQMLLALPHLPITGQPQVPADPPADLRIVAPNGGAVGSQEPPDGNHEDGGLE